MPSLQRLALSLPQYSTPARSSAVCTTQRQPFRSTVQQSAPAPLLQYLEERLQFPGAQSAAMLPTLRSAARWLTTSNHAHRSFARSPSRAQGGGSIAAGHRSVRRTAGRTQRPAPAVAYCTNLYRYPISDSGNLCLAPREAHSFDSLRFSAPCDSRSISC